MPPRATRQERDQAVQKRAYRLLAYICAERHDFARAHLAEVLEALLAGVATSLSAAKRYRLRCLQARARAGRSGRPPSARVLCESGADRRASRQAWPADGSSPSAMRVHRRRLLPGHARFSANRLPALVRACTSECMP
jgi:hypothetical protein